MEERQDQEDCTLYTIGHSNHTPEDFLALLRAHEIEVLIDTRSAPFSRFAPHFNKDALKTAVQAAGIKYGFYGRELGGRPEGEAFYDAKGHVLYAEVAKSPQFCDGLARVISGAEKCRVVLLCSEEDPSICHRRLLIARVLDERGATVIHIRGDGRLQTERELQGEEAREAAKRALREEAARIKLGRKLAAAEARLEKQREKQREKELEKERKRPARAVLSRAASVKTADLQLFDTEEAETWKSLPSGSPKAPPPTSLDD